MRNSLFALILFFTPFFITQASDIEVGLDDVLEAGSKTCTCDREIDVDRTCIASPKSTTTDEDLKSSTKPLKSGFDAVIVNGMFQLNSVAYYLTCQFDKTPAVFTDPKKNELFKDMIYYDFHGENGSRPLMQVVSIDAMGNRRNFSRNDGVFTPEKFYENMGSPEENYKQQYRGEVAFSTQLSNILTERHMQEILAGTDYVKTLKVTMMIELKNGMLRKFGEYTLKARFFKKDKSISVNVTRE